MDWTPGLVLVLSLAAPVAWGDAPRLPSSGKYELVDPSKAAAAVEAAVDRAAGELGFLTRTMVRSRLLQDHAPRAGLRLTVGTERLGCGFDGQPWVETAAGQPEDREVDDHGKARVTQRLEGEVLVQLSERPEGTRRLEVRRSADGVSVRVRLESPRLPRQLEYELSYRRVAPEGKP